MIPRPAALPDAVNYERETTMSTIARFRKSFEPLCILFENGAGVDNTADVDAFTRGTAKPGGFRARAQVEGEWTHEVYDYVHQSWINVKAGMWIARGPVDEHYPIAAEVVEDPANYTRIDVTS